VSNTLFLELLYSAVHEQRSIILFDFHHMKIL